MATSKPQDHLLADINLLLVALIWGINMPVMKYAIGQIDPYTFNAVRLTLSAITLGFCTWLQQQSKREPLPPTIHKLTRLQTFLIIAGFSILTGAIYQIAFVMGMFRTTAGNTALIMSSIPMWTALISVVVVHERLGRVAWIGLTVTFIGTAVVTLQKSELSFASDNFTGNLIILFSALAWAIASVISRPILQFFSPIKLAFLATLGTLPVHYVAASQLADPGELLSIHRDTMICVLYSGIFSTGFAYAMWNLGVKQLGASHASIFQNMVPLVALVCSWYFLGEQVTAIQLLGGALIMAGVIVVRRNRRS